MLGHKNPNITMQYYAHSTDVGLVAGAEVIDSVMRKLPSA
jgi:integrase